MKFFSLALAVAAGLSVVSAHAVTPQPVNLLTNGSFETPSYSSIGDHFFPSGSTDITGWTAVGPGETQLSRHPTCTDGNQCVDLTGIYGYDKGLRSDAVQTVVGATYRLSFDLGNVIAPGFGSSTVSVSVNDGAPVLFTNVISADPSGFEWESKSMDWVADAASARITFLGAANGSLSNNAGILLDKVVFSAVPVPEPETTVLMLTGLALVGLMARRGVRG
ncbi:MAG TPA: DUF642 domain-containing protein [Methyloversatilis sp.]